MKRKIKKILFVKNIVGDYPREWIPIMYNGKEYWLGGNMMIPIFDNIKEIAKAKYHINKQMARFNLRFMTVKVEDVNKIKSKGSKWKEKLR